MRSLIVLLSVALIFAGIAAVMYVDMNTDNVKKSANNKSSISETVFSKRQSMREIDSITSTSNYSFTLRNGIIRHDSSSGLAKKI